MCPSVARFHSLQFHQLGKNKSQQSATFQINESLRRYRREKNLVQFVGYPFAGNDLNPFPVAAKRFKSFIIYIKTELGGKTNTTHHPQRIVAECYIRIERGAYRFLFQIVHAAERIDQLSETVFVQANRKRINRKVPAVLIIFQSTVFHYRFAGITLIRLFACTYEFHLHTVILHLCSTEILEYGDVCSLTQVFSQCLGHLDAAPHHYYIYIFRRAFQKNVAYVATHHIALQTECIGRF